MKRVYLFALLCEAAIIASMIATFKLAAINWDTQGFAEYSLIRRLLSFVIPVVVVGLDIGIPKFVAQLPDNADEKAQIVLASGIQLVVATGVAVFAVMYVFSNGVAHLLMGSSEYSNFMPPLALLLFAISLHSCLYSYLRGRMRYYHAALVQAMIFGVIPVLCFLFATSSLVSALWWMGWLVFAMSCAGFLAVGITGQRILLPVWSELFPLFRYSSRRVPAAMALMAISSLPVLVVAHLSGTGEAGYLAFGILLVGVISTALSPIGFFLLPTASRAFSRNETEELRVRLKNVVTVVLVVSVLAVLLVLVSADMITLLFFGQEEALVSKMLRITILGAVPAAYFTCLRSIVDAKYAQAINSRNVLIALVALVVVLAGTYFGGASVESAATAVGIAYVVAFGVLGTLTVTSVSGAMRAKTL